MSLVEQLNYSGGGLEENWLCFYKSHKARKCTEQGKHLRSGRRDRGRECSIQGGRYPGRQDRQVL